MVIPDRGKVRIARMDGQRRCTEQSHKCFACRKELRDCRPNIGGSRPSGRRRRQTSCVTSSLRAQCWKWPRSTKRWPSVRLGGDHSTSSGLTARHSQNLTHWSVFRVRSTHPGGARSIPCAEKRPWRRCPLRRGRQSRLIMVDVTTRELSTSEKQGSVVLSCWALGRLSRGDHP